MTKIQGFFIANVAGFIAYDMQAISALYLVAFMTLLVFDLLTQRHD